MGLNLPIFFLKIFDIQSLLDADLALSEGCFSKNHTVQYSVHMFRGCKRLSRPASLLLPLVEGGQDILQLLADLRYTVKKGQRFSRPQPGCLFPGHGEFGK